MLRFLCKYCTREDKKKQSNPIDLAYIICFYVFDKTFVSEPR